MDLARFKRENWTISSPQDKLLSHLHKLSRSFESFFRKIIYCLDLVEACVHTTNNLTYNKRKPAKTSKD